MKTNEKSQKPYAVYVVEGEGDKPTTHLATERSFHPDQTYSQDQTKAVSRKRRLDLRDSPRGILLSSANNLAFYAEIVCSQRTDRKQARTRDDNLVSASGLMRFHSMPSATGGITRLVCARMRESGIQLAPLLSRAGLSVEQIDNRSVRLKVRSQIRFLELAADALQDDLLGFHLARDYDLREVGLLYYVLASSEILADALSKAERYSGTVNEGIALRFRAGHETAITLSYVDVEGDRIGSK